MPADEVATQVGQKIVITEGKNTFTKNRELSNMYKAGSVLTVKKFSNQQHKYTGGFHIAEVEEFQNPSGVDVAIYIGEYKLL